MAPTGSLRGQLASFLGLRGLFPGMLLSPRPLTLLVTNGT